MDVKLLYFDGCPNCQVASERLLEALQRAGQPNVEVALQAVETEEEAASLGFAGSPTILIDGRDPFAVGPMTPSLSCRIYRTATGQQGSPTVAELEAVLRR